jgi:hypothetical protein
MTLCTVFNTRCCEYSLIELLMMGVGYARNMQSDLQEIIKYCTKCHFVGTFLKLKKNTRLHIIEKIIPFELKQSKIAQEIPETRNDRAILILYI